MARILRREDYDKDTKEILLWHSTSPHTTSYAYFCLRCSFSFVADNGPHQCPACGHLYLKRRPNR